MQLSTRLVLSLVRDGARVSAHGRELQLDRRRRSRRRWQRCATAAAATARTAAAAAAAPATELRGLQCQQMQCPGGGTTTLTGKVYAPNGTLPLYNAIVYVPNSAPTAFTDGVTCDRCSGSVSGDPVVQTLTDSSGSFTLTDVPVGANIPLVIQLGKWRRQVTIPSVPSCVSTPLDAGSTTPAEEPQRGRHAADGDRHRLRRSVRVPAAQDRHRPGEITTPSTAGGRIHFYLGANEPGHDHERRAVGRRRHQGLYANLQKMLNYDVVMLPCEGTNAYSTDHAPPAQPASSQYLNAGGRLFSTHYSYQWLTYANSPFNPTSARLERRPGAAVAQQQHLRLHRHASTPASRRAWRSAQWLGNVDATPTVMGRSRSPIRATTSTRSAQRRCTRSAGCTHAGDNKVAAHRRSTRRSTRPPTTWACRSIAAASCSATSTSRPTRSIGRRHLPGRLHVGRRSPTQEKALAFMLFDLSSCVQSDSTRPDPVAVAPLLPPTSPCR